MNITSILWDRCLQWNVEAYSTEHESLGSSWTTIRPQKSPISCTSGTWLVHSGMPEESCCWLRTPASVQAERINLKPPRRGSSHARTRRPQRRASRDPPHPRHLKSAPAKSQAKNPHPSCFPTPTEAVLLPMTPAPKEPRPPTVQCAPPNKSSATRHVSNQQPRSSIARRASGSWLKCWRTSSLKPATSSRAAARSLSLKPALPFGAMRMKHHGMLNDAYVHNATSTMFVSLCSY